MTLLIDFNQISFSTFFINKIDAVNNINLWNFLMLQMIKKVQVKFKPTEIVLAVDSRSWRKEAFQYYKYSRTKDRSEQDPFVMSTFFCEMNKFIDDLKDNFPYKIVRVYGAEGDDVIAILSRYIQGPITIISSDKDMVQLLNSRVQMWNPFKSVEVLLNMSKQEYIDRMTLKGDAGDGIPNIMSDSDTFTIPGKYQECMSDRMTDPIIIEGIQSWLEKQNPQIKDNFGRNKQLISLEEDVIPKTLSNDIKILYDNQTIVKDRQKILDYIVGKRMQSIYDEVDNFLL